MTPKQFKKLSGQIRRSPEYLKWKQEVLERDGLNLKSPNVHHLKPFKQILIENCIQTLADAKKCKELWYISNGVTITKGEHRILSLLERMNSITLGFKQFLEVYLEKAELKWN